MKSMLKDAGILFAITLVAGLLLGCVYQITKEPIARQEALAQENACREVFSDAESCVDASQQAVLGVVIDSSHVRLRVKIHLAVFSEHRRIPKFFLRFLILDQIFKFDFHKTLLNRSFPRLR